jgi:hypothetical protein
MVDDITVARHGYSGPGFAFVLFVAGMGAAIDKEA